MYHMKVAADWFKLHKFHFCLVPGRDINLDNKHGLQIGKNRDDVRVRRGSACLEAQER